MSSSSFRLVLRSCAALLTFALIAGPLAAQSGAVAGVVTNRQTGDAIASAEVTVPGTALRTLTTQSGRFRFDDVAGTTVVLHVRVIGFRPVDDTVTVGDLDVRIGLDQKAVELSRVIVTGTAAPVEQRQIGNAVSRIDAATVTEVTPINDVQSLLNGRAAGVLIQPATGAVGSGSRIRLRGASSFSLSSQPLVYVDGVRVDADNASGPTNQSFGSSSISRINDFNPDDIESVEIVKGPAAATLYGTEASNGVIQIITKHGAAGPARWSFTLRQGVDFFSNPEGRFPTNYQVDSAGNLLSINLRDLEAQVGDIFRTGHLADYQASVSGGTPLVRYYVAGGTSLQGGAEPSNDLRHTNGRLNLLVTPSDKVSLTANMGYLAGPTDLSCEAGCGGRMFTTYYMNPRNVGTFREGFHSGLPYAYDEEYHFGQNLDRFTGSVQLQHHPVPWFTQRLTFGVDRAREVNSLYQPRIDSLQLFFGSDALGYVSITDRAIDNTSVDYAASAGVNVSPTLHSTSSAGLQFYHAHTDYAFADGQFFPAPGLSSIDATTGPRTNAGGLVSETKSIGAYGQEELAWRDRLFLTGGLRSDDQSTFGPNFSRVYYPKGSVSWVLSDEPFWHYRFVNQLRLRAAYGESGRAPPYNAALRTYAPATGPGDVPTATPQNIGNPDLGPERGREVELGFDAGLWNDALGLEFTYYRKNTSDEILLRSVPPSGGTPGQQYFNAGEVLNQGLELLARAHPYERGPVSVNLTFNLATNSNKILSLMPGVTSVSPGTFLEHRVGYPVGSWFAKRVVSAQFDSVGNPINVLCDDGNHGTVACASAPNVFLGRTLPSVEGAFSPAVTLWRRLRLSGLFDFKTGYKKLDGNTRVRCVIFLRCLENFRPLQGDPVRVAEEKAGIPDFYINDASFLKLRELTVGYTLPEPWVTAVGASRVMVSVTGRNLLTWTRYPGLEPEAMFLGGSRGGEFSSWEQATLPQLAQWVFTVNVDY